MHIVSNSSKAGRSGAGGSSKTRPMVVLAAASLGLGLVPLGQALAADGPAATPPGPLATVAQGVLEGAQSAPGISTFLGVPFAAPPVGPLRWRAPQAAARWTGVRPAKQYGAPCAQNASGFGPGFEANSREDCLTLNIWAPATKPAKPLPVMFYIHGGGFVGGTGGIPTFDGGAYVRRGVILVTVNYRLGVLGFFSHPELTGESPHKASGNYGLADQQAALRWVQANIAAFGGDPKQVTIFGQSAGSISVHDLMASPLSRGLFKGAIGESGTPLLRVAGVPNTTLPQAEKQGSDFAASIGAQSLADLRAMPATDLMKRWSAAGGRSWPIVDGWVLPQAPDHVFAAGRAMRVPLIEGSNAREGLGAANADKLPDNIKAVFGTYAPRALAVYQSEPADALLGSAPQRFATDSTFRCPAVAVQNWQARTGAPVYGYHFEDPLPGGEARGSQHSDEVPFVFGTVGMMMRFTNGPKPSPQVDALSDKMVAYWTNFAKTGNPNGAGVPNWPRYTPAGKAFIRLNSAGVRADTNLRGAACDLFVEMIDATVRKGQ